MSDSNTGEFILYASEDGELKIDVRLLDETVWLTQKQIAEVFDVNVPVISKHIKNIYKDNECIKDSSTSNTTNTTINPANQSTKRVCSINNGYGYQYECL